VIFDHLAKIFGNSGGENFGREIFAGQGCNMSGLLSQLSYKPEYEVVCLVDEFARWVLTTLPKFSATPVAKILAARFLRDKVAIYGLCSPS